MRISAFFVPFFALMASAVGFYLRLTERWNVFDARTGLAERGAGITYALIACSVVYLLLVLLFAARAAAQGDVMGLDDAHSDFLSASLSSILEGHGKSNSAAASRTG